MHDLGLFVGDELVEPIETVVYTELNLELTCGNKHPKSDKTASS